MKSVSKTMYIIGNVMAIIAIVFLAIGIITGSLFIAFQSDIAADALKEGIKGLDSARKVEILGTAILVSSALSTLIEMVVVIIAFKAVKKLDENDKNNTIHIVMLVISLIGGNIFYLLGSIFGLVSKQ